MTFTAARVAKKQIMHSIVTRAHRITTSILVALPQVSNPVVFEEATLNMWTKTRNIQYPTSECSWVVLYVEMTGPFGQAFVHISAIYYLVPENTEDHDDDDDELYYSLNCLIARHTCFANRGDPCGNHFSNALDNIIRPFRNLSQNVALDQLHAFRTWQL